jgi:NADH dehydrogenase
MAGAIAELARLVIAEEFRHVNPRTARIVLIEAGPRILSGFPPDLSAAAEEALRRKGVEVLTHTRVEAIDAEGVIANGQRIVSGNVLWSAGVAARPVAQWLSQPAETGRGGRVKVNPDLSLPGRPEIFVIGDAAEIKNAKGEILPGVAPVAKQQGAYVARLIEKRLTQRQEDTKPAPPFIYRDYGALATVGRYFAIADFRRIHLKGRVGWWLWGIAHIYYLIGFRNRLAVATSWLWEYLTYRRGSRLIITEDALPPSQRIHHATPPF